MGLISNVVAYDFGYIGIYDMVDRVDKTLTVMETMERYKGHFLTWYDIKTVMPIEPRQVATVESGNLAAYCLTIEMAFKEYLNSPIKPQIIYDGLINTMRVAELELFDNLKIKNTYKEIVVEMEKNDFNIYSLFSILKKIEQKTADIKNQYGDKSHWNNKLQNNVKGYLNEGERLYPWAILGCQEKLLEESSSKNKAEIANKDNSNNAEMNKIYNRMNALTQNTSIKDMLQELKGILEAEDKNKLSKELVDAINRCSSEYETLIFKNK